MSKRYWGTVIFVLRNYSENEFKEKAEAIKKVFPGSYKKMEFFNNLDEAFNFLITNSLNIEFYEKRRYEFFCLDYDYKIPSSFLDPSELRGIVSNLFFCRIKKKTGD